MLSAFSNAGQRCASGTRIIIFEAIYDRFRAMLVERAERLRVGPADEDDFGPVINAEQLDTMLAAVDRARRSGAIMNSRTIFWKKTSTDDACWRLDAVPECF